MNDTTALVERPKTSSLIVRIADRYGVEPGKLYTSMREVFKNPEVPVTEEAMFRLAMIIDEYKLNPITHELYAFLNKAGQVVPFIGVDGWLRILNSRPEYDGIDIDETDPEKCTVTIHRKDRTHPTTITEWLRYCKRNTAPWGQNPPRMLRHKATMQCVRYAFGLGGLYDEDEARQIAHGVVERIEPASKSAGVVRTLLAGAGAVQSGADGGPIESGAAPGGVVQATPAPLYAGAFSDDYEPPARTLAEYTEDVMRASCDEDAQLTVAEARDVLPSSQHAELVAFYRGRWPTEE